MKLITQHTILISLPIVGIVFIYLFKTNLSTNFIYSSSSDSIINREKNRRASADNQWQTIYDELKQNKPLHIVGKDNVLIKNSVFEHIKGDDAIAIENSNNVYIDNVVVDRLSGKNSLSGIRIHNSTNVTIDNSIISRIHSRGHSAGIKITGSRSANIAIDGNHIYETYGNGIVSGGCSDCAATQTVHDTPVPGLKITNNLIHDTGKTPTPKPASPTHGMYIKAQDAYIVGNNVYNVFDGEGISIRSTAIVRNNKVWDTKLAAVGFLQMKPPGNSRRSIIENNQLFFTKNKPKSSQVRSLLFLNWSKKSSYPLRYENFLVRNNQLAICTSEVGDLPLIKLYPFSNLTLSNNQLIDQRETERFFSYLEAPEVKYEQENKNSFNSASCSGYNLDN